MTFESTAAPTATAIPDTATPAAAAPARQKAGPLTDTALKALKPAGKVYKVTDGGGMYVVVTPARSKSFRFDYRFEGKRQTLTIGQYESGTSNRSDADLQALDYGAVLSLKDARTLRDRASRQVAAGENPSKVKVLKRATDAEAGTFGAWAAAYIKFKSDPKSGDEQWADSTLGLKKSVYERLLAAPLSKRCMDDIKRGELAELFDRIKENNGPGPAVHAREFVLVVYRFAMTKDEAITVNPVEAIPRRNIATFVARERNLNRHEVKIFFDALQHTQTSPTFRLALRFILLTMVRKGEFIGATWKEVNWDRATWTIPAARMKGGKEHVVPLSNQALDILTTLRTCFPSSVYLHPGRYETDIPISDPALNRVIDVTVKQINKQAEEGADVFETFSVHDLRRTASTRLNEALFPEPLIEASLAHVKKDQVAAAYNHAKHMGPRRALMQGWADIVDCWMRGESAKEVIAVTKAKINEAAHGDSEADL
jgi:integrase